MNTNNVSLYNKYVEIVGKIFEVKSRLKDHSIPHSYYRKLKQKKEMLSFELLGIGIDLSNDFLSFVGNNPNLFDEYMLNFDERTSLDCAIEKIRKDKSLVIRFFDYYEDEYMHLIIPFEYIFERENYIQSRNELMLKVKHSLLEKEIYELETQVGECIKKKESAIKELELLVSS